MTGSERATAALPQGWEETVHALVHAAAVVSLRHPNCGAVAGLRQALNHLPAELVPQVGAVEPHPEDDREDGAAEIIRLSAEVTGLRKMLEAAGRPTTGMPLCSGDHVSTPDDLLGRLVNISLVNGLMVAVVRVRRIGLYRGRPRLHYRLPRRSSDSAVTLDQVAHLYVYRRDVEDRVLLDPGWQVQVGTEASAEQ